MTDGRPRVLRFEEDPCYCQSLAAEVIELAAGHDRFVLTRFSPKTGSCVGLDVVRILTVDQEGALEKVWSGTTFEGNGSRSEIATVEFIDRDGDADLEIVRRGRVIDCGDDCPCRDGPVLATFETVFDWDGEQGRFVEVP